MPDPLNPVFLRELQELMQDDFPTLLQTFLVESTKQHIEVWDAWRVRDMERLRGAAHSLKGCCGNVGAMELQSTLADLEHAARVGRVSDIESLLQTADDKFVTVMRAVRAL